MSDPGAGEALTGTEERPIERIPVQRSTLVDWLVLLGGPTIWITHFMVVYLAGEAACTPTDPDQWTPFGEGALQWVTVVATVVGALACATVAWFARDRQRDRDPRGEHHYVVDMARAGYVLALGAVIGVIAVGAPAVYLSPLC